MPSDLQIQTLVLQIEVEDLIACFDDAVIRNDRHTFRELWTADADWEMSLPVPMRAMNKFFFRSTGRPVLNLEQDRAKFRSPSCELARRDGGVCYANIARCSDGAKRENGQWRFVAAATDHGYGLQKILHPRLGLKADVASGDHDPSGHTVGTFSPLFPKGKYFGEADLNGPSNVIDIMPNFAFNMIQKLRCTSFYGAL